MANPIKTKQHLLSLLPASDPLDPHGPGHIYRKRLAGEVEISTFAPHFIHISFISENGERFVISINDTEVSCTSAICGRGGFIFVDGGSE